MGLQGHIQIHVSEIQSGHGVILFERAVKKCGFLLRGESSDMTLYEFVPVCVHAVSS
jgi:hypothetical protein